MRIEKFEELQCWQEARKLTRTMYAYTKNAGFSNDLRLTEKATGASISIMTSISEGFHARSAKAFIRFLGDARRSVAEVQCCLYVALDQQYIQHDDFIGGYLQCTVVRKLINSLIGRLNSRVT
jgi:four helix bundle protein